MRTGIQIAIGSLAGVLAAGLAVVLFFATSNFLVMFAATPCVLGLAGVPAGFLAARSGGALGQGVRGGALAGGIGMLVVSVAAVLATLLFGAAGFMGGGFEREGGAMTAAIGAVCGGGLLASIVGIALAAGGGALGGLLAGSKPTPQP